MSDYTPHIDDIVTVSIPGEVTRARIVRLVSKTAAIVELLAFTTNSKDHGYKKGDHVPCQFKKGSMNLMGWQAIDEAELARATKPEEVETPQAPIRMATEADIFGPRERKGKKGASHAAASGK